MIKDHFPEYWIHPDIDSYDVKITAVEGNTFTLSEPFPFFIEGGGQPDDKVTVFLPNSTDPLPVVKIPSTHSFTLKLPKNFSLKAPFTVTLTIDLKFRQAVMRAHTCQHLLSALILKDYHLKTTKAVMKDDQGQLFFDKPFPISSIAEISLRMTNFISKNPVPVTSHVLEAGSKVDHNGQEVDLSKIRGVVPQGAPFVRVLSIGSGVDLNTCGGTHISSTDQILSFVVTTIKKTELSFICGLKGLAFLADNNQQLVESSHTVNQSFDASLTYLTSQFTSLTKQQIDSAIFTVNLLKTFFASLHQKMDDLNSQDSTTVLSSGQFKDNYTWKMWSESGTSVLLMALPVDKKIASEASKFFSDIDQPCMTFLLVANDSLVITVNHPDSTSLTARSIAEVFKKAFPTSKGGGNDYMAQLLLQDISNPVSTIEEYIKGLFH